MSAVVKFVKDVVDVVVEAVVAIWDAIGDVLEWMWKEIGMPILEFAFSLLGITDEDIISTEVITQRIIQDTDSYNSAMTRLALMHQDDPNGSVIEHYVQVANNIRGKFGLFYEKGKASAAGLPYTNIRSMYLNPAIVVDPIESTYDISGITIMSANKAAPDKYQWVGYQLRSSNNYDSSNMTLDIDGNEYSVTAIDYDYDTDKYVVTCSRTITEDDGTTSTDTQTIEVDAYVPQLHAVVKYYENDDDTKWFWWVYKIGSGTYPAIDDAITAIGTLELMPIVPLRNNFVNTNSNKSSTAYIQSKELLDTLGVDIDDLTASINASPDIGNVADAFVHLSVNLADNTPEINKLVYETFAQMYEDSGLYDPGTLDSNGGVANDGYAAVIKEGAYNVILGWKSQNKVITYGRIGTIGTYSKSISGDSLIMRKQATEEYYITYTMTVVNGMTLIDRSGEVGATQKNLTDGIEIPLSFFALNSLDTSEQMNVFPYALKFSIYAATITHLEWYETEAFGNFIRILAIVVAVIVTVLTWGAASSFGAFLISMVEMIGIGLVVGYAMKKLMESGAPDWLKAVGAVILVIVAIYLGNSASAGEFLNATQLSAAVTSSASSVIGTAAAAVSGLANGLIAYERVKLDELEDDSKAFQREADLRQETIDDAYEHLTQGLDVNEIQWLMDKEHPEAYLRGTDAFMYRAKGGIQYEYAALFDYNVHKDDFISNKLNVGII